MKRTTTTRPDRAGTNRTEGPTAETNGQRGMAEASGQRRVAEMSHTNPYTGESAGQLFNRGPIVRADGGQPTDEVEANDEPDGSTARMKDVSHTPPNDADDANRVFERGSDGATNEPVGDDE